MNASQDSTWLSKQVIIPWLTHPRHKHKNQHMAKLNTHTPPALPLILMPF